ncbi:hypothetical protein DMB91_08135 [Campylobacter sp. MIT 97-5078]|nr:hypothetical protein LR59_10815 [Campylobacter sp. MIT 97-5078]TQR23258.1 hypothetical protein DMB91_08135 [Campylobacter sp. MIT 97-5078]
MIWNFCFDLSLNLFFALSKNLICGARVEGFSFQKAKIHFLKLSVVFYDSIFFVLLNLLLSFRRRFR